jgi:hypothetical protein
MYVYPTHIFVYIQILISSVDTAQRYLRLLFENKDYICFRNTYVHVCRNRYMYVYALYIDLIFYKHDDDIGCQKTECLCLCICIQLYAYIHTYIYTYIRIYTKTYI